MCYKTQENPTKSNYQPGSFDSRNNEECLQPESHHQMCFFFFTQEISCGGGKYYPSKRGYRLSIQNFTDKMNIWFDSVNVLVVFFSWQSPHKSGKT